MTDDIPQLQTRAQQHPTEAAIQQIADMQRLLAAAMGKSFALHTTKMGDLKADLLETRADLAEVKADVGLLALDEDDDGHA
jgi:hypothetical protein